MFIPKSSVLFSDKEITKFAMDRFRETNSDPLKILMRKAIGLSGDGPINKVNAVKFHIVFLEVVYYFYAKKQRERGNTVASYYWYRIKDMKAECTAILQKYQATPVVHLYRLKDN